jgi:hypothetical protein
VSLIGYAISVIETMPVAVLVLLNAHICDGETVTYSSSTPPWIFMLPLCAVHDTDVPSPMTSHPWTSLQTRICQHSGPKLVEGTDEPPPP